MSIALDLLRARAQLYRAAQPHGAYLGYMRETGLGLRSLGDPDPIAEHCGCMAVTTIRVDWEGHFEFAHPGEKNVTVAAVIEAFGRDGEALVDLVAWPVEKPDVVHTHLGRASMLGVANVYRATTYIFGKPLQVHRTPLEWLKAGCEGAVVIDPKQAAWTLLEAPGRIAGQDRRHSEELARIVGSLFDRSRFVSPATELRRAA